jgi:hypothetical protein
LLLPEESLIVPKGTDACDRWFERTYPDEDNPILDRRSCNRLVRELAGGV